MNKIWKFSVLKRMLLAFIVIVYFLCIAIAIVIHVLIAGKQRQGNLDVCLRTCLIQGWASISVNTNIVGDSYRFKMKGNWKSSNTVQHSLDIQIANHWFDPVRGKMLLWDIWCFLLAGPSRMGFWHLLRFGLLTPWDGLTCLGIFSALIQF